MEGHCSTGQSPQWAVVPMEEEEKEEEEEEEVVVVLHFLSNFEVTEGSSTWSLH